MRPIEDDSDIARGLQALAGLDPRLAPVIAAAGPVPLRRVAPGFASLVSIVVSQQISRASAEAIMGRLAALCDPLDAATLGRAEEDLFRKAGLSRPKQRTLVALSHACLDGTIDLGALGHCPPDEAMRRLTAVHGIGPWTAEIYLLFALGHPDILPAGDIALQVAAGDALGLGGRVAPRDLAVLAESWSPWRGIAARLLWAHYRRLRGREVLPATAVAKRAEKTA